MLKLITACLALTVLALPAQAGTVEEALNNPGRLAKDLERDQRDKPAEIIALLNIKAGDRVADIFGGSGYYSEIVSQVVGPDGEVLLHNNQAYLKYVSKDMQARFGEREVPGVVRHDREPADLGLGESTLDAVIIIMSYHDLYYTEEGWPPIDRQNFMGQIVTALKAGGRFLIVDHQAAEGAGMTAVQSLHRIEASVALKDIESVGLEFVGGTDVLRNNKDDHSLHVFDPAIQGKTDRFVQVFEKPAIN
ncbi:MAG: hypothetical protein ABJN62_13635 [Halioglobus sp.]